MRFEAEVRQVRTCADMTVNVTFNLPEYQLAEAQQLLAMIGDMVTIECQITGAIVDERPSGKKSRRNVC